MNLKDLEFKAEDFYCIVEERDDCAGVIPQVAYRANQLLLERLEKAPQVFGDNKGLWGPYEKEREAFDTHTARLVCIDEIK